MSILYNSTQYLNIFVLQFLVIKKNKKKDNNLFHTHPQIAFRNIKDYVT